MLNPNGMQGVAQLLHTASGDAVIGDTIVILADPAQAEAALGAALESIGTSVTGTPEPSAVADNATVVAGTSPEGDRAITVLLFTEQNAFVTLQFDSQPGDLNPVPPDFVESVGVLQQAAVQDGLPNVGPAVPAAGAAGPAAVSVDGQPLSVAGPVDCSTHDGKFSIAVGDPITGVIVGLEPDASVVRGVGLGTVNGVVMSFTEGAPGNVANATKDGANYVITGTATGVDEANPAQQISKPFKIEVTCP
jgi:lipoprotein LpqH